MSDSRSAPRPAGSSLRIGLTAIVLTAAFASPVRSQSNLTINLAEDAADTVQVSPGDYRIRIVHRVPRYDYSVTVQHGFEAIPKIPTPSLQGLTADCADARAVMGELRSATDEGDVPGLLGRAARALADTAGGPTCSAVRDTVQMLVDTTSITYETVYSLSRGEYIDVVVSRAEDGGKSWRRRYTTGARGSWELSYGFAFPYLGKIGGAELTSAARRIRLDGDSGSFVVEETPSQPRMDITPSVMISYLPVSVGWFHVGPIGGFSIDLTHPNAFLGVGFTFWSNFLVSVGIGVREERVAQYEVDDTVAENLNDDQLYVDDVRVRPFFGVTYRFDGNPLASSDEAEEEAEAEPRERPRGEGEPEDRRGNRDRDGEQPPADGNQNGDQDQEQEEDPDEPSR